jgi:hypothetical protein
MDRRPILAYLAAIARSGRRTQMHSTNSLGRRNARGETGRMKRLIIQWLQAKMSSCIRRPGEAPVSKEGRYLNSLFQSLADAGGGTVKLSSTSRLPVPQTGAVSSEPRFAKLIDEVKQMIRPSVTRRIRETSGQVTFRLQSDRDSARITEFVLYLTVEEAEECSIEVVMQPCEGSVKEDR